MLQRMRKAKCVIYNRLVKTGSTTTDFIIDTMAKKNGFRRIFSQIHRNRTLNSKDINNLNYNLGNVSKPWVFIRHIYFWDTSFMKPAPVYINTVRDPVERLASEYYYHRRKIDISRRFWEKMGTFNITFDQCVARFWPHSPNACFLWNLRSYAIQFFCGQTPECANATQEALNIAKRNVRRHYVVVADLSDFDTFFQVLEFGMPRLFRGAGQLYYSNFHATKKVKNKGVYTNEPSFKTVNILKRDLSLDYEFYYFIRQRYHSFIQYLHNMGMNMSPDYGKTSKEFQSRGNFGKDGFLNLA